MVLSRSLYTSPLSAPGVPSVVNTKKKSLRQATERATTSITFVFHIEHAKEISTILIAEIVGKRCSPAHQVKSPILLNHLGRQNTFWLEKLLIIGNFLQVITSQITPHIDFWALRDAQVIPLFCQTAMLSLKNILFSLTDAVAMRHSLVFERMQLFPESVAYDQNMLNK